MSNKFLNYIYLNVDEKDARIFDAFSILESIIHEYEAELDRLDSSEPAYIEKGIDKEDLYADKSFKRKMVKELGGQKVSLLRYRFFSVDIEMGVIARTDLATVMYAKDTDTRPYLGFYVEANIKYKSMREIKSYVLQFPSRSAAEEKTNLERASFQMGLTIQKILNLITINPVDVFNEYEDQKLNELLEDQIFDRNLTAFPLDKSADYGSINRFYRGLDLVKEAKSANITYKPALFLNIDNKWGLGVAKDTRWKADIFFENKSGAILDEWDFTSRSYLSSWSKLKTILPFFLAGLNEDIFSKLENSEASLMENTEALKVLKLRKEHLERAEFSDNASGFDFIKSLKKLTKYPSMLSDQFAKKYQDKMPNSKDVLGLPYIVNVLFKYVEKSNLDDKYGINKIGFEFDSDEETLIIAFTDGNYLIKIKLDGFLSFKKFEPTAGFTYYNGKELLLREPKEAIAKTSKSTKEKVSGFPLYTIKDMQEIDLAFGAKGSKGVLNPLVIDEPMPDYKSLFAKFSDVFNWRPTDKEMKDLYLRINTFQTFFSALKDVTPKGFYSYEFTLEETLYVTIDKNRILFSINLPFYRGDLDQDFTHQGIRLSDIPKALIEYFDLEDPVSSDNMHNLVSYERKGTHDPRFTAKYAFQLKYLMPLFDSLYRFRDFERKKLKEKPLDLTWYFSNDLGPMIIKWNKKVIDSSVPYSYDQEIELMVTNEIELMVMPIRIR